MATKQQKPQCKVLRPVQTSFLDFSGAASGNTVQPVLEPLPKWSLVHDIMEVRHSSLCFFTKGLCFSAMWHRLERTLQTLQGLVGLT